MKKNKGFTLVELLSVIVILGILVGIAIPVYFNIFRNIKENEYVAKKKYIEEIAVRFAEENSVLSDENKELITLFTPVKLIATGYLSAEKYIAYEDGEIPFIENPKNVNDNLVCHTITLKIEDYSYYAELSDEDTNCMLSSQEIAESRIGIKAYEIKEDGTLDNEMLPSVNNNFKWVKNNVALVINPSVAFDLLSYNIGGKDYVINKNNMFNGSINEINQSNINSYSNIIVAKGINGAEVLPEFKFTLKNAGEDYVYSAKVQVRIDKRTPRFDYYPSETWINNKTEVLLYINDGQGSGSKGLCYNNINERSTATCVNVENPVSNYKSKTVKISDLENGNVYLWPMDMVENEPNTASVITIKNVDINAPVFEELSWIIDSDVSCDNGVQCSNYQDTTCTCRKMINGQMVANDVIYDRVRTLRVKYSDSQSGVKIVNYCITQDDSCTPNNAANINFNNNKMEADISWTNSENQQKVCYQAVDNVGNSSDVRCSDKYYVNNNV